ncbi:MAG: TRAP transporter small permease [Planctomycetes bacterium]|nr:TRAP transporter small permease [Planctomycetota bacterium]
MVAPLNSVLKVLQKVLEFSLILVMSLLVLDVIWGVLSRFVLGSQSSWTEELARILLIWTSFLGASLAFGCRAHLGLDYVFNKVSPDARRYMAMLVHLVILVFTAAVLVVGGMKLVLHTLEMEQRMMALPFLMKGHVYAVVPLSGLFTVVFTVGHFLETLFSAPEEVKS